MTTKLAARVVSIALAIAGGADAGPHSHHRRTESRAIAGNRLFKQRRYTEALFEYRAGYAASHDATFLVSIAGTYQALGRIDQAIANYRQYLADAPHGRNVELVRAAIAQLEADQAAARARDDASVAVPVVSPPQLTVADTLVPAAPPTHSWSLFAQINDEFDLPHFSPQGVAIGAGAALTIVTPHVSIEPTIYVDGTPTSRDWGATFVLDFDRPITSWLGIDVGLFVGEQQRGSDLGHALAFVGLGPGLSTTIGPVELSIFIPYFKVLGSTQTGWAVLPTVSYGLEL